MRREMFHGMSRLVRTLLSYASVERLHALVQSWPELTPVKVKDVDLLACKPDKAEETLAALLKTPDTQRAGKKKVRQPPHLGGELSDSKTGISTRFCAERTSTGTTERALRFTL
jgi:hypothetical protein